MSRKLQMMGLLAIVLIVETAHGQAPDTPPGGVPGGNFPGGPPGGFPGGFPRFEMPKFGQIFLGGLPDQMKLSADQKKELAKIQKDVDTQFAKILTAEQKKTLQDQQPGKGGFGGGGFGPPGFGPPPGGTGGNKGFGPPGGFGGFGGGFGAKNDDVKKQLGATDEEWKVIGPKLEKVAAARRVLTGSTGKTDGPFGGSGNAITQAQADLKTVLDDPKHSKSDVEEKTTALRKARQQARTDLDAAQREVRLLVTLVQEAILMSLGQLD